MKKSAKSIEWPTTPTATEKGMMVQIEDKNRSVVIRKGDISSITFDHSKDPWTVVITYAAANSQPTSLSYTFVGYNDPGQQEAKAFYSAVLRCWASVKNA